MSLALRLFLIIGAALTFLMVIRKIRKTEMQSSDSVFWLLLCGALVVIAVFPQIVIALAYALGFESAANFVLLLVIAILLIKVFSLSSELARLRQKVTVLVQEIALRK